MKVITLHFYIMVTIMWNLRGPGDLLGMSLFPILCSCPVHHNSAALVVLTISGDQ
jgi:C4-dicarboxylate transporter